MDHVAWIQKSKCFSVLLDRLLVFLLLIQSVSVLFYDFLDNLGRQTLFFGDGNSYIVVLLLDKLVNLLICIHWSQTNQFSLIVSIAVFALRYVVDSVLEWV